jgi:hypothetical protein
VPPAPWVADFLRQHGATIAAEGLGAPTIQRRWGLSLHAARQVAAEARARGLPSRNTRVGVAGYAPPVQPEPVSPGRGQPERDDSRPVSGSRPFPRKGNRRETDGPGSVPSAKTATPANRKADGRGTPCAHGTRASGSVTREPFAVPPGMFDPLDILVLPDPHAEPGQDLWRFRAFGRQVAELRPAVVVCIGDLSSFDSLSRHATPREREGARYLAEVEATKRALDLFHDPIAQAAGYRPRLVFTSGNHDAFGPRFAEEHPALVGMLGEDPVGLAERGWEVHPFRQPVEIAGVLFCHYFENAMGKPIGGKYAAATVLARLHQSAVWGHTHGVSYHTETRGDGTRMHALNVGVGSDAFFAYAGPAGNRAMYRGDWLLRSVVAGDFDPQAFRMDTIRKRWG